MIAIFNSKTAKTIRKYILLIFVIHISLINIYSQDINFYKDFKKIYKQTKKSKSDINFYKLLERFKQCDSTLTEYECSSLIIGSTGHNGYKSTILDSLENKSEELVDNEKYEEAKITASQCLDIYPLSVKAIISLWRVSERTENEKEAKFYLKQSYLLFKGIQNTGYSGKITSPEIILSLNNLYDYANLYAVGSGITYKKSYPDKKGNTIVECSSFMGIEYYIIPMKQK